MALGLELLEALDVTTVEGGAPAAGRTASKASCDTLHAPTAFLWKVSAMWGPAGGSALKQAVGRRNA
jgi:hypothetical protein